MKQSIYVLTLCAAMVLAGCSDEKPSTAQDDALSEQVQPVEQAEAASEALGNAAKQETQAMDQQTGE